MAALNGGRSRVSKKTNQAFFDTYIAIDKMCCEKFGIDKYGITEYITRLNNARFAPNREQVLPTLVKYRNLRNSLAHDEGAMKTSADIQKSDVKWLRSFEKQLKKKRDPMSAYLKKAYRHKRLRRLRKILIATLIAAALAAAAYGVYRFVL